jgi:hypothetical protein
MYAGSSASEGYNARLTYQLPRRPLTVPAMIEFLHNEDDYWNKMVKSPRHWKSITTKAARRQANHLRKRISQGRINRASDTAHMSEDVNIFDLFPENTNDTVNDRQGSALALALNTLDTLNKIDTLDDTIDTFDTATTFDVREHERQRVVVGNDIDDFVIDDDGIIDLTPRPSFSSSSSSTSSLTTTTPSTAKQPFYLLLLLFILFQLLHH